MNSQTNHLDDTVVGLHTGWRITANKLTVNDCGDKTRDCRRNTVSRKQWRNRGLKEGCAQSGWRTQQGPTRTRLNNISDSTDSRFTAKSANPPHPTPKKLRISTNSKTHRGRGCMCLPVPTYNAYVHCESKKSPPASFCHNFTKC